jgi:hypothetical protein
VKTAAALIAAFSAAVAPAAGPSIARGSSAGGFGASEAVHIMRVGQIEIDLEPAAAAGLRRVACAGPSTPTTSCFVAAALPLGR